ncbi:hypothetical protein MASR1M31_15240 [Porphyromonadaceae bacterium]
MDCGQPDQGRDGNKPESGISWVDREFETLPTRPQDKFSIREEDIVEFREEIFLTEGRIARRWIVRSDMERDRFDSVL